MRSGWRAVWFRLRWELAAHPVLFAVQSACFVTWVAVLVLGTYLNFFLPRLPPPAETGCYFTDHLIVHIECRTGRWELPLSVVWYWTWGIRWMLGFLPFSLPYLLPAMVTAGFALGFTGLLWRLRRA